MQRLLLNLLSVIFLFVACKGPDEKDIISKGDFTKALTEIQLTDAYLNILPIDSARKVIHSLYQVTFDRYGLDSISFKKNIDYYGRDAQVMQDIYAKVEKNLTEKSTYYSKLEQHKQDSIRTKDSIMNAHIQDSINRVVNFKQQYEEQLVLIKNYIPDTSRLSYIEASRIFYKRTGLTGGANLETYIESKQQQFPVVAPPAPIAPPATPVTNPTSIDQKVQSPSVRPLGKKLSPRLERPIRSPQVLEKPVNN